MTDRYGPRGVLAFLVPQQNANMQPEYEAMRPTGVSNQIYRFELESQEAVEEAGFRAPPAGAGGARAGRRERMDTGGGVIYKKKEEWRLESVA